ncbi:hypothetical protein M9Y10_011381 [Tritrichomonas musculus]|uniref:ATPase dynein-related AAA domain-containing protein n=1 Tax=Tritrichomonas musculus TaxID=1915356 RepID=A0ABR2IKE0_9EUKA
MTSSQDIFGDKKIEIDQFINYICKIATEFDSKWTVTPETYSVTIKDAIERTFSKSELESFEQQIMYLTSLSHNEEVKKNKNVFEGFLKIIQNIRKKHRICNIPLCFVHNPFFYGEQNKLSEPEIKTDDNDFLFKDAEDDIEINPAINVFNFGIKDYYLFGKSILEGSGKDQQSEALSVLFNIVTGGLLDEIFLKQFRENELMEMKSFDPIKIGRCLVNKMYERSINKQFEFRDFEDYSKMSTGSMNKLSEFLQHFSKECSLLIANVPKPSHIYHVIQPAYIILESNKAKGKKPVVPKLKCPREYIIFCTENKNFQQSLNKLMNCNENATYFIIHPENLKLDEMQSLKSFILARKTQDIKTQNSDDVKDKTRKNNFIQKIPNVIIITALPTSFFAIDEDSKKNMPPSLEFEEEDIKEFATFNAKWRTFSKVNNDVFLISSKLAGIGKTYHINEIINKAKKIKIKNDSGDIIKKEITKEQIYFDITTEELPDKIKNIDLIHVSISPELFRNNFQLMDQFYLLIQYGYFIFQNGSHISYSLNFDIKPTFLIEIPKLEDGNSLTHFYDFPIAPTNNDKPEGSTFLESSNSSIYSIITEEFKDVTNKENFKDGLFDLSTSDNEIQIGKNVRSLMELIFNNCNEINNCKELIKKSQNLFFSGGKYKDGEYIDDNRIISKVGKMIEDYSKLIIEQGNDDYTKRILFLLTIRTILYVWHFTPKNSKNLMLLVPQRIITNSAFKQENGWIIVSFLSKHDQIEGWSTENTQTNEFKSDIAFDQIIKNKFKDNAAIHILTDESENADNDLTLQTRFFKTILLFLPEIEFENDSANPLQVALILLLLFSDMNHYPDKYFSDIITFFMNQNYTDEDLQKKLHNLDECFKWSEIDKLLHEYFKTHSNVQIEKVNNINKLIIQMKSELSKHENIWNIIKISFSKTYFCRFIEIILKIYYQHFSILQGDTGCGKTSVVNLLNDVLTLAKSDLKTSKQVVNWSFFMIDFHGNFTQKDFMARINKIEYEKSTLNRDNYGNEKIIIFLDELNTSPAYYYVIDQILNKTSKFFSYIAAINAKDTIDKIKQELSRVGIRQKINLQLSDVKLFSSLGNVTGSLTYDDTNFYTYNVKEDQESVKSSIIKADPQEFDEFGEQANSSKYLPDEEKIAIRSIITKILLQWENIKYTDYRNVVEIMSSLIYKIFVSVRTFMGLRAVFSYRDVHRCITIFTYVFDFICKLIQKESSDNIFKEEYRKKITSISIVVSIYISLISRFSREKITLNKEIEKQFDVVKEFQKSDTFSMYELILKHIQNSKDLFENCKLIYFNNWEQVTILFAYAKCMKYINFVKENDIYPLPSLMLHLLILSLTISASFHDIKENENGAESTGSSSFFTCLIIGMPGTSKSKAVEIYKSYHMNKKNKKHDYFITTYLCSRTSDSNSLLSQFLNGARFLNDNNVVIGQTQVASKKAIVILEEVGLANYNPSRPLKILHPLCDKGVEITKDGSTKYCKIIPVQLSNYAIDFANMNRGFLVCAGLPTDDELSTSISFGKILDQLETKEAFSQILINLMCDDKIKLEDEKLDSYNDSINFLLNHIDLFDDDEEQLNKQKEEFGNLKTYYGEVLKTLWEVTKNGKRPSFFPMRPLFKLISLFDNFKKYKPVNSDERFTSLSFLLNSFSLEEDIIQKSVYSNDEMINNMLKPLGLEKKFKCQINPLQLYHSFGQSNSNRKALLIRTKDYEAFRYLTILSTQEMFDNVITIDNFVPFEFQDVGKDCQTKFDELFKYLCPENDDDKIYTFVSIGNDPFSDYIIDILNVINQENQCPTAILQGFPVYLPSFPSNIKFVFIINNSDVYNDDLKNPVPYPLIDRLDHVFLDKDILVKNSDYLLETTTSNPDKVKILLGLDKPKKGKKEISFSLKQDYLLAYRKSDFEYLKDALMVKKETEAQSILNDHFKDTSIKSLNDLLVKMEKVPEDSQFAAVVFTRTPFYEDFDFKNKSKFAIIYDDHNTLREKLIDTHHRKSILIRSDIFNLPDENTLNNALSVVDSLNYKIFLNYNYESNEEEEEEAEDKENEFEEAGDQKYIVVFHINENQIPKSFDSSITFPVVWIASLPQNSDENQPLIQEICSATLLGQVPPESPIMKRAYERIGNDIKEKFSDKQKKNINPIFTSGVKLSKGTYKMNDIIIELEKWKKTQETGKGQVKVTFSELKEIIVGKLKQIDDSKKKNDLKKIEEKENELNKLNLEIEFFNNVSGLVDDSISSSFYVILKYLSSITLNKAKKEKINVFVHQAFEYVPKLGKILPITYDTFGSKNTSKEVNASSPSLVFYNILKQFFIVDIYYNSLNLMKKLLDNLCEENISDVFKYINDNYYNYDQNLPYNNDDDNDDKSKKLSVEDFDEFFNTRGLINDKKDAKAAFEFIQSKKNGKRPNLIDTEIKVNNIRNNMNNGKWSDLQYKQILLSDCYYNFMDSQKEINLKPHPCLIYHHFVKVPEFSFINYEKERAITKEESDNKIFENVLIPWILNFFLYGTFNDCDESGKINNYKNLTKFIDCGIDFDNIFESRINNSEEICHFAYDCLFSEFCKKNKPIEKITEFEYSNYINDFPTLFNIKEDHSDKFNAMIKHSQPEKAVFSKEINNTDYDYMSEESKNIIKDKFKEIKEIEDVIVIYKDWKSTSYDMLGNSSLFENIRSKLFKQSDNIDDQFGNWFLNTKVTLITRQVYEVCKAIKNGDENQIKGEFNILKSILNPWNDDDCYLRSFWKSYVESDPPFTDHYKFDKYINEKLVIKDIINNCQPYYICKFEEGDNSDPPVMTEKTCIIARNVGVKTYFIERYLYSMTMFKNSSDDKIKIINQIFDFMTNLPFVHCTKHIYVLAGFINEILRDFRDQMNLLFLILETSENCVDLLNYDKFKPIINDNNRTESPEILEEALKAADSFNKGTNAPSKLKSYINRLIEINNKTILIPEKSKPNIQKFRIITKGELHTNVSLMNTILPALAHIETKSFSPTEHLIKAFKVLTGHKDAKDLINKDKFFDDLPSIYAFAKGSATIKIMVNIIEIKEGDDLFGLKEGSMALSLCEELSNFLSQESNKESYRVKIWNKIENTPKSDSKPDYSKILNVLIPLFEEYDKSVLDEHLFFSTEGWKDKETLPENLEGIEAAAYFLKTYKVQKSTLFDTIKSRIVVPTKDSQ